MPKRLLKTPRPKEKCLAKFSLVWEPNEDPNGDPIPVLVEVGGMKRVIQLNDSDAASELGRTEPEDHHKFTVRTEEGDDLGLDETKPVHIDVAEGKGGKKTEQIMSNILRELVGDDDDGVEYGEDVEQSDEIIKPAKRATNRGKAPAPVRKEKPKKKEEYKQEIEEEEEEGKEGGQEGDEERDGEGEEEEDMMFESYSYTDDSDFGYNFQEHEVGMGMDELIGISPESIPARMALIAEQTDSTHSEKEDDDAGRKGKTIDDIHYNTVDRVVALEYDPIALDSHLKKRHRAKEQKEDDKHDDEGEQEEESGEQITIVTKRPKDETPDEKKARKAAVKQLRQQSRARKAETKATFKRVEEKVKREKMARKSNVQGKRLE